MQQSQALDLEPGVFTWRNPKKIAASLKFSAETSHRRKLQPYASAMAMLCFYINRAGRNLQPSQLSIFEQSKQELRKLYGRRAGVS